MERFPFEMRSIDDVNEMIGAWSLEPIGDQYPETFNMPVPVHEYVMRWPVVKCAMVLTRD